VLTLDHETREQLNHERREPTATHNLDRALRADQRLNITARLAWLMTALSHRRGFASMSIKRMARELNAAPVAVRQARKRLVRLGVFTKGDGWKYHRAQLPGEGAKGYWRRIQADRRLDRCARAAWLLADLCKFDGEAEVSMAEIAQQLNIEKSNARVAVRRVLDLGLFMRVPRTGRGRRNRYRPVQHIGGATGPPEGTICSSHNDDDDMPPTTFFQEMLKWQKTKK
jgi:hypothetical protein